MITALFLVGFSAAATACCLIGLAVYRAFRDCRAIGRDEHEDGFL